MEIKIFVALIATSVIVFISCNWFGSKKKEVVNSLVGEWKLDSIQIGKDTSAVYFLTFAAIRDTIGRNIVFTEDSIFLHSKNAVDSVGYSYEEKTSQLNIKDAVKQSLAFNKVNDSLIRLTSKDNTVLFLQKK